MNTHRRARTTLLLIAAVFALPAASFAQLNAIISGGFAAAYQELLPEFQKTSGITVTTISGRSQGDGPNTFSAQLRLGVLADVVIMSKEGLGDLIAEGRIAVGTDVDLARTPLGVSVRAGAPRPDISTVEAFKKTLLRAHSVTSPSGAYIYLTTTLFPQLGIVKEMAAKVTSTGVAAVANGEAEITVQPISELLHAPGVDFVGTIPAEIQRAAVFTAAIMKGTKQPEAGKRLIVFLASENAETAIKKSGMEPLKSH